MIVTAGLLIDFGNSNTRVIVISGNKSYRFNLSNKFAELPQGYNVNKKYNNDKTTIFANNGSYFANGQIVEHEFSGVLIRPSALQSKTDQLVTDLTINLAFIKALSLLAQVHNLPVASLDVTFNVSALLPPLDHEINESKMEAKFQAMNNISTLIPLRTETTFKIGTVQISSEAVSAFFGAFFKEEGLEVMQINANRSLANGDVLVQDNNPNVTLVEVEGNKRFMDGYVLVLDIGAGTSDVAIFQDMELIERSKETFKLGGNTVESIVRQEIRKFYGYSPTDVAMKRVISEGSLEEGNTLHDVAQLVTNAKAAYSQSLMKELTQYLERAMIDMPVIKGLLVAGGGSLPSVRDGAVVSPAMAEVLISYLKTLAPRLEPLDVTGKDLRDLNIEGLMFMHKYS
jgi:hypothetical protein